MVDLTQKGLGPLGTGPPQTPYQFPDNGGSQTVNSAKGPILALQVTEGFRVGCGGSGPGWVFPASSAAITSAAPGTGVKRGGKTWDRDPAAFGAIEASDVLLSITASGYSSRAIVLNGINFQVIHREPAQRGVLVNFNGIDNCDPAQKAFAQVGDVNLDASPPIIRPIANTSPIGPSSGGQRAAPLIFPYTISESDPEILILDVSTHNCDCTWTAELDWTAGPDVGQTIIKDHGHLFRTTAATGLPTVNWQHFAGSWIRRTGPPSGR